MVVVLGHSPGPGYCLPNRGSLNDRDIEIIFRFLVCRQVFFLSWPKTNPPKVFEAQDIPEPVFYLYINFYESLKLSFSSGII